jgi:hypothetical protein
MTAGQWLSEFRVAERGEGKTQVFTLANPVRIAWTEKDDRTHRAEVCRTSTHLFALLSRIAYSKGIITAASWRGAKLGAQGLFLLNFAQYTYPQRKGGKNIVRSFVENRDGAAVALRGDWAALLSYLEIRPVFRAINNIAAPNAGHYV